MIRFQKKIIHAYDNDGRDTGPYLVRWALNTPWFGIKLHHILRSDEDRDLHDHPWSFVSIILAGGYFEHTYPRCPGTIHGLHEWKPFISIAGSRDQCAVCRRPKNKTVRTWCGPGIVLWRPAPSVHRLELPAGRTTWSLVITGPKRREWGFHTICGFIPWFRYNVAKAEGC